MEKTNTFSLGDSVLLIYNKGKKWLKKIEDKQFHTNYGYINLLDLVGKTFGVGIETNKGKWLKAYPPTTLDWISSFEHQSQIIYSKDAGKILLLLDIKEGDVIYEAGTGSGALTAIMAKMVGEKGTIITHEMRESAYNASRKNLNKMGITNVQFNLQDVLEKGFTKGTADGIILDLVNPWEILPGVTKILNLAGKIVIFLPTFNQLEKTVSKLKELNFDQVSAIELFEREIQLKEGAIRPSTRMIGFTGYLISAIFRGSILVS